MERKGGSTTAVAVTADEVRAALGRAKTLTSEEEKALRMRHGAGADLRAPLPRAAGSNLELADELMLIEMQLLRASRGRTSTPTAKPGNVVAAPRNAAKDKIIRVLRKKK
jgi:hypothetical protein